MRSWLTTVALLLFATSVAMPTRAAAKKQFPSEQGFGLWRFLLGQAFLSESEEQVLGEEEEEAAAAESAGFELKVIGAGFGRTGTSSTMAALEILGFENVHHMQAVVEHDQFSWWVAAFGEQDKGKRLELVRRGLQGFQANLDFPSCLFYRDLMELFPKAKVLLTSRDADSWARSAAQTVFFVPKCLSAGGLWRDWRCAGIYVFLHATPFGAGFRKLMPAMFARFNNNFTEAALASEMVKWEAEVEANVPPDRLLKFDVRQGWAPLADFLGVAPPPDGDFPRVNDRNIFQALLTAMGVLGYLATLLVLASPWVLYHLARCCVQRLSSDHHKTE